MEGHFPVFVSFAHKDNEGNDQSKRYLDRLKEALEPLALQTQARAWSDEDFEIGDRWENEIRHAAIQDWGSGMGDCCRIGDWGLGIRDWLL